MLRFGGLKYKKLNNATLPGESRSESGGTPTKADMKMGKSLPPSTLTTPPAQDRLHNQLNGAAMKNACALWSTEPASVSTKPLSSFLGVFKTSISRQGRLHK
ncbi:Trimethylamine-N-oxide reductase [Anopheles sinensis]|uniref:Trimethylamine-N-oxide reductase n=1 Tax=Anopheles sinensis TaxID=74873 RepID=A0A084W0K6_ANOSI|nr:Trimethylamine-N-oxide reductase [Anopheles sinensis]